MLAHSYLVLVYFLYEHECYNYRAQQISNKINQSWDTITQKSRGGKEGTFKGAGRPLPGTRDLAILDGLIFMARPSHTPSCTVRTATSAAVFSYPPRGRPPGKCSESKEKAMSPGVSKAAIQDEEDWMRD
jgi:hypothetical protein